MKAMPANNIHSLRSLAATIGLVFFFVFASSVAQAATLLVSNRGSQTITKYNLATGAYLGVFASTAPGTPFNIACDSSGNVYVSYGTSIHKFDADGNDLGTLISSGIDYDGIGIHNGVLYLASYDNGTIRRYALDGTDLGVFTTVDNNGLQDMVWDSSGNLLVADYNGALHGGTIQKVAPDGSVSQFATLGGFGYSPGGMAIDNSGNVYASDWAHQNIRKFNSSGTDLGVFASIGAWGLIEDQNNNLYATGYFLNAVRKWAANGTDLGNFITTGVSNAEHLAIMPDRADLSVVKIGTPNPVGVGSNITYKITMANAGPQRATNVVVVDPLPTWTSLFSYGAIFGGTLSNVANNVTIRIRSLAVNEVKTITLVARVNAAMVGGDVLTNTVTITSDIADFNPGDNVASSEVTVRGAPHITTGNSKTFSMRRNNSFILRATGVPAPAWSLPGGPGLQLAVGGPLPSGVTFVNNGDGTATLSGTPAPGTGGNYNLLFTAANGVKPDARQTFILTVNDPR